MLLRNTVEHSELRKVHPDGTHGVLLDHGEVTGATLAAAQRRNKGGDGLMLALYHGAKFGAREVTPPWHLPLCDVPIIDNLGLQAGS